MPVAKKKVTKKRAAAARKRTAEQIRVEEQLRWEVWQKRIVSVLLTALCIAVAVNELLFTKTPSEAKLVFVATVLGVPLILSGAKKGP